METKNSFHHWIITTKKENHFGIDVDSEIRGHVIIFSQNNDDSFQHINPKENQKVLFLFLQKIECITHNNDQDDNE